MIGRDALKAAQLSAVNQLQAKCTFRHIEVRQWRALIAFRQQLVSRRGQALRITFAICCDVKGRSCRVAAGAGRSWESARLEAHGETAERR